MIIRAVVVLHHAEIQLLLRMKAAAKVGVGWQGVMIAGLGVAHENGGPRGGALSEICSPGSRSGRRPWPLGGLMRSVPDPCPRGVGHPSTARTDRHRRHRLPRRYFRQTIHHSGLTVAEAPDVPAIRRRPHGKSDALDVIAMAQASGLNINELAGLARPVAAPPCWAPSTSTSTPAAP